MKVSISLTKSSCQSRIQWKQVPLRLPLKTTLETSKGFQWPAYIFRLFWNKSFQQPAYFFMLLNNPMTISRGLSTSPDNFIIKFYQLDYFFRLNQNQNCQQGDYFFISTLTTNKSFQQPDYFFILFQNQMKISSSLPTCLGYLRIKVYRGLTVSSDNFRIKVSGGRNTFSGYFRIKVYRGLTAFSVYFSIQSQKNILFKKGSLPKRNRNMVFDHQGGLRLFKTESLLRFQE